MPVAGPGWKQQVVLRADSPREARRTAERAGLMVLSLRPMPVLTAELRSSLKRCKARSNNALARSEALIRESLELIAQVQDCRKR